MYSCLKHPDNESKTCVTCAFSRGFNACEKEHAHVEDKKNK